MTIPLTHLIRRSVLAKIGIDYDFSSTQIQAPADIARAVKEFSAGIPDDILHNDGENSKGRENDIHITLLYGLKTKDPEDVRRVLSRLGPFQVRLGLVTCFMDKPEYDVLKIDAESSQLYQMHYKLRNALKNENKFPTYSPHMTICYLKKGTGLKYLGDETFKGRTWKADSVLFSNPDNERTDINLG
jgi:2'-5' RNA ligase